MSSEPIRVEVTTTETIVPPMVDGQLALIPPLTERSTS